MLRRGSIKKRPVASFALPMVSAAMVFVGCSDHASLPSASTNDRIYDCSDIPPVPESLGGDDFAALYHDIFTIDGVAGCQTSTCHGNTKGPGGNGMAMYPPILPSPAPADRPGISGVQDDRGLYCGLTSHLYDSNPRATSCGDASSDCACNAGDTCVCGAGPNENASCCNTSPCTTPTCDALCRRLVVRPHADGSSAIDDSALLTVLSPTNSDVAFMPRSLGCGINRKLLPSELARIRSWLGRGAPYDGKTIQPAYVCPPAVKHE